MGGETVLLADCGGTHARFALLQAGAVTHPTVLRCVDHAGPAAAAAAFLAAHPSCRPSRGAFAVAACVDGDQIDIPNSSWLFSVETTRRALGLRHLEAINDFTAVALSLSHLAPEDLQAIGGGGRRPGSPVAVLGPGTGLGVSALVPAENGTWVALETEGGHATMAAANDREAEILGWLRRRLGHVSAEQVLSGPGLVNLYLAVAALAGREAEALPPDAVSRRGLDGSCASCRDALALFFAMLGTVAANLALSVGARGGVFIAGGILPRMAEAFGQSAFRSRFEAHGAFGPYLAAIPTHLVLHPHPAFLGLASLIEHGDDA